MSFKNWLIEIGKSIGTADKYSRAVSGVISNWIKDSGISTTNLDNVHSIHELLTIQKGLQNVDIYIERNKHGNNMYSCALNAYIEYRKCESSEELEQDVNAIVEDNLITNTEKSTFIKARIGQGIYRNKLIQYWGKCALTNYGDSRFLVASHIKPWRASNNEERLDTYNGLLLLPNLDKIFDLGFITFSDKGKIIVSSYLEEPNKLGVTHDMQLAMKNEHKPYMKYHRKDVYERNI